MHLILSGASSSSSLLTILRRHQHRHGSSKPEVWHLRRHTASIRRRYRRLRQQDDVYTKPRPSNHKQVSSAAISRSRGAAASQRSSCRSSIQPILTASAASAPPAFRFRPQTSPPPPMRVIPADRRSVSRSFQLTKSNTSIKSTGPN
jgi:hypothetical protein